jgi:hypothetical protein
MLEASSSEETVFDLRPGELVRVRTPAEIHATLDENGALDGMPFMPEMVQYCGRTFAVAQRADRTCHGDGIIRRMPRAVHLANVRCDGSSHGGCQAACLVYWKEAWLERIDPSRNGRGADHLPPTEESSLLHGKLLPMAVTAPNGNDITRYRCQATEIPRAAGSPWRLREVAQYRRDLRNWDLRKFIRVAVLELFNQWQAFSHRRLPPALRIAGGHLYPFFKGKVPKGETPSETLGLQPGELVRIKSRAEILATLDDTILEGVVCAADYHRFCTRAIYSYWREIWLERVDDPLADSTCAGGCSAS